MSVLDIYNPKKIKENWNKVRSSPYASLKFQYWVAYCVIITLVAFIVYNLFMLIINYDAGSSMMTLVGRAIILLITVLIAIKSFAILTPLKNTLKQYEGKKEMQAEMRPDLDVGKEVDEILNRFEKKENDSKKPIKSVGKPGDSSKTSKALKNYKEVK